MHRHDLLVVVFSKAVNGAKNASVPKQTTGLSDISVDGVYLTFEGFTLLDLGTEFLGKNNFAIGFR